MIFHIRLCVATGDLRTGGVFHAIRSVYGRQVARKILKAGYLENVLGMMDLPRNDEGEQLEFSSLDWAYSFLCVDAMLVLVVQIEPRHDLRRVASRPRLYFLHWSRWLLLPGCDHVLLELAKETLSILAGQSEPSSLSDILLPEASPQIQGQYTALLAQHVPAKKRKWEKWPAQHESALARIGADWCMAVGPSLETYQAFPGLRELHDREIDVLSVKSIKVPDDMRRVLDLNLSVKRCTVRSDGSAPAVTPSSRHYITDLCRLTHGVEACHLQGLHFGGRHNFLDQYGRAELVNIGGNAFEARSSAVSFITLIVVLARAWSLSSSSRDESLSSSAACEALMDELWGSD
jgi:hypothetical protein